MTATSSHAQSAEAWTRCCENAHPRVRIRSLRRHITFAFISYLLCVLVFVIFALSIETVIVIDPHPCIGDDNKTETPLNSVDSRFSGKNGPFYGLDGAISAKFNGDGKGWPKSRTDHISAREKVFPEMDKTWYCNYTFDVPHEDVWLKGTEGKPRD